MKERLLVLAKTYPQPSTKYGYTVCIAGITGKGEWRRLYPVPWETFWENKRTKFSKKQWIEYELRENTPSDYRSESRKVKYETIRPQEEEDYSQIERMLEERVTTIESLQATDFHNVSLGVIRPKVSDFIAVQDPNVERKEGRMPAEGQKKLSGEDALRIFVPPLKFQYGFACSPECTNDHKIMIEDWEVGEAYREWGARYGDEAELLQQVKNKFVKEATKSARTYFIMGNHVDHPKTYLIIGLIRPRKEDGY